MKRKIFLHTISFGFISLLQPLIAFLLLPLYTNKLSISDFGLYSLLMNIGAFINLIASLGISSSIVPFYSNLDPQEKTKYYNSFILFSIISNIALFFFVSQIAIHTDIRFIHLNYKSDSNFTLLLLLFLTTNIFSSIITFSKCDLTIVNFLWKNLLFLLFTITAQLIVLYKPIVQITDILIYRSFSTVIATFLIIIIEFKRFRSFTFNLSILKESLKYGLLVLPAGILNWFYSYNDRFIIFDKLSSEKLGLYSVVTSISSIFDIVIISLGSAIQIHLFRLFIKKDDIQINKYFSAYCSILILVTSSMTLGGSVIHFFIKNPAYQEAGFYFPIIITSYFFSGLYYFFNLQTIYSKKAVPFIYISIISLVASTVLNLYLIPLFNIWGASISLLLTKIIIASLSYYYGQKNNRIQYNKTVVPLTLICLFIILIGPLFRYNLNIFNIWNVSQFVLCFSLIVYMNKRILVTIKELFSRQSSE